MCNNTRVLTSLGRKTRSCCLCLCPEYGMGAKRFWGALDSHKSQFCYPSMELWYFCPRVASAYSVNSFQWTFSNMYRNKEIFLLYVTQIFTCINGIPQQQSMRTYLCICVLSQCKRKPATFCDIVCTYIGFISQILIPCSNLFTVHVKKNFITVLPIILPKLGKHISCAMVSFGISTK